MGRPPNEQSRTAETKTGDHARDLETPFVPCLHCFNPDAADGELGTRAVALLLLYPLVPESPHWLAVSGDAAGAEAVLRRMAAANGAQLPPGRLEALNGLSMSSAGVDSCICCHKAHWVTFNSPHRCAIAIFIAADRLTASKDQSLPLVR